MFVLNISFVFPLFFHSFWSSKFQKMMFFFLFLFNFFPQFFNKNLVDYICSYPCNFWGLVYIFQIFILMCIMCLMQILNNYEIPFVINAIQLQLYHYQLYIYQHAITMVIIRTYWWTHDMVVDENRFRKVFLDVRT
jgi:hypothetical protein